MKKEIWFAWLDGKRDEGTWFEVPEGGALDIASAAALSLGVEVCNELNVERTSPSSSESQPSISVLSEMMGSSAKWEEAYALRNILIERGIVVAELPEKQWLRLIDEAVARVKADPLTYVCEWLNESSKADCIHFADSVGLDIGQIDELLHEDWQTKLSSRRVEFLLSA